MRKTRCWIHDVDEEITLDGTVCFECKHSYPDDEAIRMAFRELSERSWSEGEVLPNSIVILKGDSIDDIGFCPICLHDW